MTHHLVLQHLYLSLVGLSLNLSSILRLQLQIIIIHSRRCSNKAREKGVDLRLRMVSHPLVTYLHNEEEDTYSRNTLTSGTGVFGQLVQQSLGLQQEVGEASHLSRLLVNKIIRIKIMEWETEALLLLLHLVPPPPWQTLVWLFPHQQLQLRRLQSRTLFIDERYLQCPFICLPLRLCRTQHNLHIPYILRHQHIHRG